MSGDDDFRVRPGRMRGRSGLETGTALRQVRIAVSRAGGASGRGSKGAGASTFGRGRKALAMAPSASGARRLVVVKARVVRRSPGGLGAHIGYLQRDGVTRDGEPGRLFDARSDVADASGFAERARDDRHHFRFIVSPEDARELNDLRAYTRDLMTGMERDLATPLDWVAVDHWNTAHPHIHVIVRGRLPGGDDLVISRDYISKGMRARAEALAHLELGPPGPNERAAALAREVRAEHRTRLDQRLERLADPGEGLDLRPLAGSTPSPLAPSSLVPTLVDRLRTLEGFGLATNVGPGRWRLVPDLGARLLSRARDAEVVARLDAALQRRRLARTPEQWTTAPVTGVIVGRVLDRGLDDELRGSGFAVIDGMDGRVRHITLADAGSSDPRIDAIVRISPPSRGAHPMTVTVSDLDLDGQVRAPGATWLDRRLLDPSPSDDAGGFAAEAATACDARIDHLVREGLAERRPDGVRFARNLLITLRARELEAAVYRIQAETGLAFHPAQDGNPVSGIYRRRLDLASGRFAMIDDGLGFSLVPWRAPLEKSLGRPVVGLSGPGGEIDWRPPRGLGR
jgi:type IV secretory pathway VirD2 relaxase